MDFFCRYKTLEIKNILLETTSHHILPQMLMSPLWVDLGDLLKDYLKFMDDHLRESADLTFLAYRHRNYSKVSIYLLHFKLCFVIISQAHELLLLLICLGDSTLGGNDLYHNYLSYRKKKGPSNVVIILCAEIPKFWTISSPPLLDPAKAGLGPGYGTLFCKI